MAAKPTVIVCVGMAGSGKTTFMQRINSYLHQKKDAPYVMNLDPAVKKVPFDTNIDIRDSINYKEVMEQYNLGPNGGIMTSLNLFATKVDQILAILEKRTGTAQPSDTGKDQPATDADKSSPIKNIIVDTPGQIEVFVWSASGQILLSALASSFPTVLAYVVDTPRTASTSTFMSNMLYACSILYKTKLPMILVFNKTDVQSAEFAKEWMTNFESFQAALKKEEETGYYGSDGGVSGPTTGSGYMNTMLNSMSLTLEEFYCHLDVVGVSSMTGAGIDDFFTAVNKKAEEFERDYRPELERRQKARDQDKGEKREKELGRLMSDLDVKGESSKEPSPVGELDEMDDSEDDDDDADDDGEDEASLRRRYQETIGQFKPPGDDDLSFVRYIQRQNG